MATQPFDLDKERERANDLWRSRSDANVPLSVAAAIAFHQAHGSARAIATRADYDDALNLAASALARLIPVYALQDPRAGRRPLDVDFARDAFVRGATRLRQREATLQAELSVLRSDLASAIGLLKRTGLPLLVDAPAEPRAPSARPSPTHPDPRGNRILAALSPGDYAALQPHLEPALLRPEELLFIEGQPLRHVYFPTCGLVSVVYITADGHPTEIAIIGNDGMVGVTVLLGGQSTLRRSVVQVGGHAYRAKVEAVAEAFRAQGSFHDAVLRYVQALMNQMAQTSVCNRHHTIEQQLSRWLLLCLDRLPGNGIAMTQETISQMLGVRRAGVTEAALKLQRLGLIHYRRGLIQVADRAKLEAHACECYGVVKRETERLLRAP